MLILSPGILQTILQPGKYEKFTLNSFEITGL